MPPSAGLVGDRFYYVGKIIDKNHCKAYIIADAIEE